MLAVVVVRVVAVVFGLVLPATVFVTAGFTIAASALVAVVVLFSEGAFVIVVAITALCLAPPALGLSEALEAGLFWMNIVRRRRSKLGRRVPLSKWQQP